MTRVQSLSEADDKTVVLIRTVSGGHFIATHEWNFETQVSYSEIRDQRSGDFLRLSVKYPYATRTRSATLDLAKKNPKLVSSDIPFEMSAPGNTRLSGIESHWRDPATAREWRTRVRQMLSPAFLEDLEIIDSSGLFSKPMLSSLHQFLPRAGDQAPAGRRAPGQTVADAAGAEPTPSPAPAPEQGPKPMS